jgi:hypothetical protein
MSAVAIDYRSMISPVVEFRLYNPGTQAVEGRYDGRFYRVPPRDECFVDPRTKVKFEPGVLPIRGYSYTRQEGRELKSYTITAKDIVTHLTGEDGISGQIGGAGVRLLPPPGDPMADLIKQEALEANERKTYEDAGHTIAAFEAMNAKRIEMKQPPLPPNPKQREAYRYRSAVDAKGSVQQAAFTCPRCFDGVPSETALREHIETLHAPWAPSLLKAAGLEALSRVEPEDEDDEIPATPIKRGPGRPPKSV